MSRCSGYWQAYDNHQCRTRTRNNLEGPCRFVNLATFAAEAASRLQAADCSFSGFTKLPRLGSLLAHMHLAKHNHPTSPKIFHYPCPLFSLAGTVELDPELGVPVIMYTGVYLKTNTESVAAHGVPLPQHDPGTRFVERQLAAMPADPGRTGVELHSKQQTIFVYCVYFPVVGSVYFAAAALSGSCSSTPPAATPARSSDHVFRTPAGSWAWKYPLLLLLHSEDSDITICTTLSPSTMNLTPSSINTTWQSPNALCASTSAPNHTLLLLLLLPHTQMTLI